MAAISQAYDWLIGALAYLAGVLVALIFIFIVADVTMREMFGNSLRFTIGTVEYMMLYLTAFSAPWLMRTHGHVYIEAVISRLSPGVKRLCEIMVCLLCAIAALVFAYFSFLLLSEKIASGELDIRTIDIPGWMIAAPLPIGYGLVAIESLRFLFSSDSIWREDNAPPEAL